MLGRFEIPILFSYADAQNKGDRMSSSEKTFICRQAVPDLLLSG